MTYQITREQWTEDGQELVRADVYDTCSDPGDAHKIAETAARRDRHATYVVELIKDDVHEPIDRYCGSEYAVSNTWSDGGKR